MRATRATKLSFAFLFAVACVFGIWWEEVLMINNQLDNASEKVHPTVVAPATASFSSLLGRVDLQDNPPITNTETHTTTALTTVSPPPRVLIYITTHFSRLHGDFLRDCWPASIAKSTLLQRADVLVFSVGAVVRPLVEATFSHNNLKVVRHEENPGYQGGALLAMTEAYNNGWFDDYDWVIRLNPDVIIRDDTFIANTINDDNVDAIFVDCRPGDGTLRAHTDFFAVRPRVIPPPALDPIPSAERQWTADMAAVIEAKRYVLLEGGGPRRDRACRVDSEDSPVVHDHNYVKSCQADLAKPWGVVETAEDPPVLDATTTTPDPTTPITTPDPTSTTTTPDPTTTTATPDPTSTTTTPDPTTTATTPDPTTTATAPDSTTIATTPEPVPTTTTPAGITTAVSLPLASSPRVLIYLTTHFSRLHGDFLRDCWPASIAKSTLLQSADVLMFSVGAVVRPLVEATFSHNNLKVVRHEGNPGYQGGALLAMTEAYNNGWFDDYDWVIRLNPDVIIRDDTFIANTINDDDVDAIFVDCRPGDGTLRVHTDFFAVRPRVIPPPALDPIPSAERQWTADMAAVIEAKRYVLLEGGGPRHDRVCRVDSKDSPVVHDHNYVKSCQADLAKPWGVVETAEDPPVLDATTTTPDPTTPITTPDPTSTTTTPDPTTTTTASDPSTTTTTPDPTSTTTATPDPTFTTTAPDSTTTAITPAPVPTTPAGSTTAVSLPVASSPRVLIYLTTHFSRLHGDFLRDCWPASIAKSTLLQSADVLMFSVGAVVRPLVEATFSHNNLKVVRHEENPGYQGGALLAMTEAYNNGWFDDYDWVIRLNPDVIIRDDTFIANTINDDDVDAIFVDCRPGDGTLRVHTDFFAVRPRVIPPPALDPIPSAERQWTADMAAVIEAKRYVLLEGGGPRHDRVCRVDSEDSPVVHDHNYVKSCQADLAEPWGVLVEAADPPVVVDAP